MFRDLKEYQELQKLYESEVSKPEQLDEFTGLGVKKAVQMSKPKPKPVLTQKDQSDIKKEVGLQKVLNNKKNLQKIETKAAADKKEVDFRLKNTESSEQSAKAEARPKRRPVPSPMEAGMGSGAARARAMAKARIAAKKANPNQNQLSGKERAQAMAKARIAAKNKASQPKPETKSGSGVSFGDAIKLNTPKPKGTVLNTQGTDNTKQQATATPTKTKPTYQSNRDKLNRSRQNQRQNQKSNPTTGKIIPKPNTGTDTQGTRKEIPQRNTGTDTQGTRKQIPQRNTGTDTETKTNTQIKKFPGSGKEIDPRAKVTQTTSTNDKGQKVTTTKTNLNLKGSEASDKIKEFKKRQQERRNKRDNVNSMEEAYASIYNPPAEQENIDETKIDEGKGYIAKKVVGTVYNKALKNPKNINAVRAVGLTAAGAAAYAPIVGTAVAPKTTQKVMKGVVDKVKSVVPSKKKEEKKDIKKDDNKMEAYDIVLDYLLSTQQVATIEEANYVMTEMDAKTIQDIISEADYFGVPKNIRDANKRLSGPGPHSTKDKKDVLLYYGREKKGKV